METNCPELDTLVMIPLVAVLTGAVATDEALADEPKPGALESGCGSFAPLPPNDPLLRFGGGPVYPIAGVKL